MGQDLPDYYAILGVPADASAEEIKRVYRARAPFYHPDTNPSEETGERFKQISEAYECLRDPLRRSAYDEAMAPRIAFDPAIVDFGKVQQGSFRPIVVHMRNDGGPLNPESDEVNPSKDSGEFYSVEYECSSDANVICDIVFKLDLAVPLGRHSDEIQFSIRGNTTTISILAEVVAAKPTITYDIRTPTGGAGSTTYPSTAAGSHSGPTTRIYAPTPARPPTHTPPSLPEPATVSGKALAWTLSAVAVLIAAIIIPISLHSGQSSPVTDVQSTPTASYLPASSLPESASTTFDVTPAFNAQSMPVSATVGDAAGWPVTVNLTPSLQGFELSVSVNATYDANAIRTLSSSILADFSIPCMDIKTSQQSTPVFESAMQSNLSSSGDTITGSLVYAAVLPGVYGFDLNCRNSPTTVGSVTVTSVGVSPGVGQFAYANNDSNNEGLAVFAERKSQTDTAIEYGIIGTTNSNSLTQGSPDSACIITYNSQSNPIRVFNPSLEVAGPQGGGNGQNYKTGVLTFNLSSSQTPGSYFYYACPASGGVATSGPDSAGGVPLT